MVASKDIDFLDLAEFYPGSKRQITRHSDKKHEPVISSDGWDAKPRVYQVNGKNVDFFTVGQLAQALGRRSPTVRKWERDGVIPKAQFTAPSDYAEGKRRLYTRAQVEGIVRIAKEEGVFVSHSKAIKHTRFTSRVIELFKSLEVPGS